MGLFVVAISVRLDIATTRRAAATRGAQTLLLLTMPFVAGLLVLIPDQPSRLLGLEFILTAGTFGVALLLLDRRALTQHASTDQSRIVHGFSPNLMVAIGLVFAGGSLAIEWGGGLLLACADGNPVGSRWCALGLVVSCRAGVVRPRIVRPVSGRGRTRSRRLTRSW
jgi:hypothetical protein